MYSIISVRMYEVASSFYYTDHVTYNQWDPSESSQN